MPARDVWEVAPHGDRWAVKRQGSRRAIRIVDRKGDAIALGMQFAAAKAPHGQLIIKRADGTIEDERTYVKEQSPPRG